LKGASGENEVWLGANAGRSGGETGARQLACRPGMSYLPIEVSKYTEYMHRESTEPIEEVDVKATQFMRVVETSLLGPRGANCTTQSVAQYSVRSTS
jgi:hypothetical protein